MPRKKDMGFSKVKLFDPKKVKKIALEHVTQFFRRVTKHGLDHEGKQLPKYSRAYEELLSRDFKRKRDGKRMKGYEGISVTSEKIGSRVFLLRGNTMSNFRLRKHDGDEYQIGWDGEAAEIVKGNADRGRDIMSDIPDKEMNWLVKQFGDAVDEEFRKKLKNETIYVGK